MSKFKIKGQSLKTQYDGKWLDDKSSDAPFLMEHTESGYYTFYTKYMEVYENNVSFGFITDGIKLGNYKIVEDPNK